jgi:hypothetical protein
VGLKKHGDKKKVTNNFKAAGSVERVEEEKDGIFGKKKVVRFVARDAKGKVITERDSEESATTAVRKNQQKTNAAAAGGGVKGQEQNPRKPGEGKSRGAQKRAAKQPGEILKAHLDSKKKPKK